jgi:protein transport protein SEC24
VTQVFKFADPETVALVMAKTAISAFIERPEKCPIRETVMQQLVKLLHAYRVNCAANTASGQLILPDSLKTVPLALSGMLKQVGVREEKGITDWDARAVGFYITLHATVRQSAFLFLTRIMCLHPLVDGAGEMEGENVVLPPLVAASREQIAPARIYLLDRDDVLLIYVGREVRPEFVEQLLGSQVAQLHVERRKVGAFEVPFPDDSQPSGNQWTQRVGLILNAIARSRKSVRLKCLLAYSAESKIGNLMVEDRIGAESGYVDWLCLIHRHIQEKIDY